MIEKVKNRMQKIYFLTRTYPGINNGGGGIIRRGTVQYLQKYGYEVCVVAPDYKNRQIEADKELQHILLRHVGHFKLCAVIESLGIWDDYLEGWAVRAVKYLKNIVCKNDILFVTSGGELGMIMLAHKLKKLTGCKFIVNLHDPLSFTTVNGERMNYIKSKIPHVTRDNAEKFYLKTADAIITSSVAYKDGLMQKYPLFKDKICHNYFGYINEETVSYKLAGDPVHIVYGGAMSKLQSPEILAKAVSGLKHVKISYIGNWMSNQELVKYRNNSQIELIDSMSHKDYINYLLENADIGFISLHGQLASLCVPSKLYEFINLGIPVLATAGGDTQAIISQNGYGMASNYDVDSLKETILKMCDINKLSKFKDKIIKERFIWSMEYRIKEVINVIEKIAENQNRLWE
jgi:glycosyltransferase involved in cell wall biosynthesis